MLAKKLIAVGGRIAANQVLEHRPGEKSILVRNALWEDVRQFIVTGERETNRLWTFCSPARLRLVSDSLSSDFRFVDDIAGGFGGVGGGVGEDVGADFCSRI